MDGMKGCSYKISSFVLVSLKWQSLSRRLFIIIKGHKITNTS